MALIGWSRYRYARPNARPAERDAMNLMGLSEKPGARSAAARRSNSARARLAPGPQAGADPSTASNADDRQADYFLRLLATNRRLVDHRLGEYRKAIAILEARGDAEGASGFRHRTWVEEQDRQALDGMIDRLRRRFPGRARVTGGRVVSQCPEVDSRAGG
jgi:hypothetical protein